MFTCSFIHDCVLRLCINVCEVVFIVQALNKLPFTSVRLIYLDSNARLQMCPFHHSVCMCGFVCLVFTPATDKVPHFSRLGDVEVNAGQNASFQCVATGKVSEIEPFLLEVRTSCLFYYLCLNSQSTSQHLDNRIGLEIVGRGGNTKGKERDVFTRLAFSWLVLSRTAYSHPICMHSCWPNSRFKFYSGCCLHELFILRPSHMTVTVACHAQ